ncbi:MAG TPA: hypothetical protein VMN39_02645, partial [Longimicrobiaceae bacterium]|nr:hypothetical protein [Longimicrobiaceae bacterium]
QRDPPMRTILLTAALLLAAAPLAAQKSAFTSGIHLHGNFHFDRSTVERVGDVRQPEHGYGLGLELSGANLGVGLYGFALGRAASFQRDSTPIYAVLEGNYYLPIESLRLAPFVGVHTGLGVFTRDYFDDPFLPAPRDGLGKLGYQAGVRFQPLPLVGVQAEWRQHASSVYDGIASASERRQILVGIVLF